MELSSFLQKFYSLFGKVFLMYKIYNILYVYIRLQNYLEALYSILLNFHKLRYQINVTRKILQRNIRDNFMELWKISQPLQSANNSLNLAAAIFPSGNEPFRRFKFFHIVSNDHILHGGCFLSAPHLPALLRRSLWEQTNRNLDFSKAAVEE